MIPPYDYKDPLGREFISLGTLSELLSRTKRQIFRHLNSKRFVSVKRDNKRYVLKDDALREYPHITERLNQTTGENPQTNRMSDTIQSDAVGIYSQEQQHEDLVRRMDYLAEVANQIQSYTDSIQSIENNSKANTKSVSEIQNTLSEIKANTKPKRGVWYSAMFIVIIPATFIAGAFGVYQFNHLHEETLSAHSAALALKDQQITTLVRQYRGLLERNQNTTADYENTLDKLSFQIRQAQTGIRFPEVEI